MKIHLRDRNPEMASAWKLYWKNDTDVEISTGDIFDGPITDAIVSPANSWGYMDGGIDKAYSIRWPFIQAKLQEKLKESFYGILPVGNALIVHIGDKEHDFQWLISAPTMFVPMDIRSTINAYLAFRAALMAVLEHNKAFHTKIESILCPGLGTAIGKMPYQTAAFQMYMAYKHILKEPFDAGDDLSTAWNLHERLRRGI